MGLLKKAIRNFFFRLPWEFWGPGYVMRFGKARERSQFRKSRVGRGSYVDPSVRILGWRNVVVGNNAILSEDVWLNVNHRDEETKRIIIGNNCHIGKRNFFSAGPVIHIKDYSFTGIDCHFLGCAHVTDSPMVPYLASGLSLGDIIEVGVNCWLTTSVTVMQGVRIGCGSVIGARSVVVNDIPPFSIAVGNPCKVIKRYDFKNNRWVDISAWTTELEKLIPTESEYLTLLKAKCGKIPLALIASSRRFGWL